MPHQRSLDSRPRPFALLRIGSRLGMTMWFSGLEAAVAESIRLRPIPKYVSIAQTSFQQAIAYRVTTLINIGLTFIWVFILYYLWSAVYDDRSRIEGFTWDDMRTYIVIAYGLNALVGWRIGANMMYTIRTGEILRDLTRPLNYCGTQLASASGAAIVEGIMSLILTLLIGVFLLDIRSPDSLAAAGMFVAAVGLGYITKALLVFCVSLLTFWTLNGVGVSWSREAIISVLSGTLIPIALMPDWLRIIAEWSPMRGIVSTPLMLYLGKATGGEAVLLLLLQAAWVVGLWFFANWAWRAAFNAVEIQGG